MKHPGIISQAITSLVLVLCALLWASTTAWAVRVVATTPEGKEIHLYNNSYALVLGNGNYSNGWDPLPGALRDADDVATALKRNGFKVTLKKNLTRGSFNEVFGRFCHKYGRNRNNRLLFYYAGHGHTEKMATNEDLGYLVMVDAPSPETDPVGFELSSVDMQTMVTWAKKIKARHVLFMFDSCFSGSVLNLRERVVPQNISESIKLPVRQFITAGRANEPVPDHSIFKVAFLDLLEGRDREPIPDGYITGEELGLYLKNKVPEYNPAQHPQYGKIRDIRLDKGDFVFQLATSGATVSAKFPAESRTTLSVSTNVTGARVLVDGRPMGKTPLNDISVSPGSHRLLVAADGYDAYEKRVRLESGRGMSVYVNLIEAMPSQGRLFIEAVPENARVRVLNIAPVFYQGMELKPGRYHLEVSAEGYETEKRWVTLSAGKDKNINIRLAAMQSPIERKVRNSLGMEFVYIPQGNFLMGSAIDSSKVESQYGGTEKYYQDEHPQHRVTLTRGFYMQTTEVTQGQWERVMGINPSGFKNCGNDCPVEKVSWNDAQTFIRKLNQMERSNKYRLPTEAEWEYALRAGAKAPFYTGDCLTTEQANYNGNYPGKDCKKGNYRMKTTPVGTFSPNKLGLYDMHGNVWEWCQDKYGSFPSGSVTDPTGSFSGGDRVYRGGSWFDGAKDCRAANRFKGEPGVSGNDLGFRLVRTQ